MILSLGWFVTSLWGRRLLAAAGILALALVIRAHFVHEGRLKALEAGQQVTLKSTASQTVDERAELVSTLEASAAVIQAASAQIQASQVQQRVLMNQLEQLQAQKGMADAALQKVPDSALHGYITSKLGLRASADNSPCYRPEEERAIAQSITDAPVCEASKSLLEKDGQQKDVELKAEQQKEAGIRHDYNSLLDYSTKLEGHYVTLYNAFASKRRGPQCLWLWKCTAQRIKAPKPADLGLPAVSGGR